MTIRKKISLIVFLSILLTAIPTAFFISYYAQEKILLQESSNLIALTESQVKIVSNRLSQSQRKLERFSRLLNQELSKPIEKNEVDQFHQTMELGSDGIWRNRSNAYSGHIESGIFLPLNASESDLQKIAHMRIKKMMDSFGAAANNRHENIWYFSKDRSVIIYDTEFPDFVFDQTADSDYTQTPWLKYTSPELNPDRRFTFTPPLFAPVMKAWMVSALYPLYLGSEWLGTLGEDMQLSKVLGFLLKTQQLYPETEHFLVDNKGNFILAGHWQAELELNSENSNLDLDNIAPELTAILKGPMQEQASLLTKSLRIDNRDFIAIGMAVLPMDWKYIRLVPVDNIVEPARQLLGALMIFIFFISILCGGLINIAVNKNVVTRIKKLVENMHLYELGDKQNIYSDSELLGSDEISLAAQEFTLMVKRTERHRLAIENAKQVLFESEERWKFALEGSGDGVWDWNIQTKQVIYSKRWKEMLGYAEDEISSTNREWTDRLHPEDATMVKETMQAYLQGSLPVYVVTYRLLCKDNSYKWILGRGMIVSRDSNNKPLRMVGTHTDVSELKQSEEKLKLAATVFTHTREGIMITDADASIVEVNDTFLELTGYSREEMIGKNPRMFQSGRQSAEFYAEMWQTVNTTGHWTGEVWNRRENGEVYAELKSISTVLDENGVIQNYVAMCSDITLMKEHQSQLERNAHYDLLTNLPNRVLLADRLSQVMAQCGRSEESLAVVFLDLDSFKEVNDAYGHNVGDELLISLSLRMKAALREGDTLARIGGDEFVAVLAGLAKVEDCEPVLERLLLAASEPITVGDTVLNVSASIGVTIYPQDSVDADQLMRHADQAMYVAKQSGKNRYHLFDTAQDDAVKVQRENLEAIRSALDNHQFVLYYQPKVNMRTGMVIGVEALIRWQHPHRGLLNPIEFLPVIENHTMMVEMGEWVIDTALIQISQWQAMGLKLPVSISVNIAAVQLQQPDFTDRLSTLLAAHPDVDPHYLELEVLETSALDDVQRVSTIMNDCMALGVNFSLDDFGTGYSSLTYLRRLPASLIKIDQSFVRDMLSDADDLAIVEGVIALAKSFKREVIAEGVETVEHGSILLQLGCELAQGYGIAKPMPASDIPIWIDEWQPDAAWNTFD